METISGSFEEKKELCDSITLNDVIEYLEGTICEVHIMTVNDDKKTLSGVFSRPKLVIFNKEDYDYARTCHNTYIEPSNNYLNEITEGSQILKDVYQLSNNQIRKSRNKKKAVKMLFNLTHNHLFFHMYDNKYIHIEKVFKRDKNAFKHDLLGKLTETSEKIERLKKYIKALEYKKYRLTNYVSSHDKIYGSDSITVIYANADDTDTELLKGIWKDLKNVNVIEITKNSENYESIVDKAIMEEKGTLIFAGHGTPYGLLHPNFASNQYLLHENNKYLIKASKVICIWCYASEFVKNYNIFNSFSTSMYISNIDEAYDYNMYNESSRAIQKITEDFCADVNNLLKNKVDLKEWHDIIVQKTDTNSQIDTFNRTNTFINIRN